MNPKLQNKFNIVEKELVELGVAFARNGECRYHLKKALEHLADAYDTKGVR